jgi:hypothetical protein
MEFHDCAAIADDSGTIAAGTIAGRHMKRFLVLVLAAGLGACAHEAAGLKTVTELHQQHVWQHVWQHEPGADLMAAMETGFSRMAHREGRPATLAQLAWAGYECTYGEAHEDYPEPMAVCTRSLPRAPASSTGTCR